MQPAAARPQPPTLGDMPPEEFRRRGYELIDWIAEYLAEPERYPVLAQVEPGQIAARLPREAPAEPGDMGEIVREFEETLLPGVTHWNHPGFFAYFATTGSGPGILGELLAAALNVNAMLWRTGPAATELEERALDWLRQMLGLPEGFRGTIQDTASTSTLVAVATAREAAGASDVAQAGRLRLYCSTEAHSAADKAGITIGIGREGTRHIATDEALRMDPAALEAAIQEDLAAGWKPFCVVATVGTTSTGAVDPVPRIAEVCARHNLWLHVDAAYAGPAAILPELREILQGCERADSLVTNPHKWLFVPVDCSALYVRRPEMVRRAFALVPEFLTTPEGEAVTNLMDYGHALGRRFRALKLWMVLRYFGREGIANRLREHMRLARLFGEWVDAEPEWERLVPVAFSLVVFRYRPAGLPEAEVDALNERLLAAVNASGEAYLSHTRVHGHFALRLAVGNLRSREAHVRRAWELLRTHSFSLARRSERGV